MSMHKMKMEKETSPITARKTRGEASSGVDHSNGEDLEDEDEDTEVEIYNEMSLLNGQAQEHKPPGNYLPKITNSRDQTKRGIKRPNGGSPNESPPKIFCVELDGILGVAICPWHLQLDQEEEEDPGEDRDGPQQEVNKLVQDLNLPDRDL